MHLTFAIVFVSDMKRSVAFYRDIVGLTLRFESPDWTEFATEGATLALHAAGSRGSASVDMQQNPAGHCRPGLGTADLDDFHQRMLAAGVVCLQAPKNVFGARIAQYLDPDGLAFSISESAPRA